jgi:multidrug transporter EmrE-like cation transporter
MAKPILILVLGAIFGALGQYLLKTATKSFGALEFSLDSIVPNVLKMASTPLIYVGLACWVVSAFLWITALSNADLSFAYPFGVALGYILVLGIAILVLGDTLTPIRIAGISITLVGIVLVAMS